MPAPGFPDIDSIRDTLSDGSLTLYDITNSTAVNKYGLSSTYCPGATPDARLANLRADQRLSYFRGYNHNALAPVEHDFYVIDDNYLYGFDTTTAWPQYVAAGSSAFTDLARGSNEIILICSDGLAYKYNMSTYSLDQIGTIPYSGWISVEYFPSVGMYIAVSSSGYTAYLNTSTWEWSAFYSLGFPKQYGWSPKIVINGSYAYIGVTSNLYRSSDGVNWYDVLTISDWNLLRNKSITTNPNTSYALKAYGKYDQSGDYSIEGSDISSTPTLSPFTASAPFTLGYSGFAEHLTGNGIIARSAYSSGTYILYLGSGGWYTNTLMTDAAENGSDIVCCGGSCIYYSIDGGSTLETVVQDSGFNFNGICAGY